jgi:Na+/proline symporter
MISAFDAAILLAFLVYSAASGFRARRASSQNLEEYFLAGRTLSGWKAGISMAATQFAADTPLLVTGMIAIAGVFSLWRLWIYALAFLLMGFVLGAAWRRASVLTDAELAELRYGGRLAPVLRVAKAIYFGTIFNCTVMAMVLFAATRIAEPFLPWDEWLPPSLFRGVVELVEWSGVALTSATEPGVWAERSASNLLSLGLVVLITALYSTTGGLRAVVNTDVVQFGIAIVATLVYAYVVVRQVGGLEQIPEQLSVLYGSAWSTETLAFTPGRARDAGWVVVGTIAIQWLAQMNADGTGYLAQRTMACRTDGDARRAAIVFVVAQVLVRSLLWIAIGLGLLVLFPMASETAASALTAEREATFVEGIARYLPPGARGLMLTGMLAALASTLDTHLNWGASYWTNDVYRRLVCQGWRKREPAGRTLVWVARASNLLILGLAIAILTRLESIQSAWKTSLLLGAGMGVPLILRWIWWRVTAAAELAAILASSALAPLLLFALDGEGARMLLMTAATSAVVIGVSVFGKPEPPERLKEFYRRVRPPGFWGPVARSCGDDPLRAVARLRRGALATAGTAFAIFCLLVGLGSWLFGSPAPAWLPWRAPWIAGLLVAAALVPVSLRSVLRAEPAPRTETRADLA